jgi:hypothetical protein
MRGPKKLSSLKLKSCERSLHTAIWLGNSPFSNEIGLSQDCNIRALVP